MQISQFIPKSLPPPSHPLGSVYRHRREEQIMRLSLSWKLGGARKLWCLCVIFSAWIKTAICSHYNGTLGSGIVKLCVVIKCSIKLNKKSNRIATRQIIYNTWLQVKVNEFRARVTVTGNFFISLSRLENIKIDVCNNIFGSRIDGMTRASVIRIFKKFQQTKVR